MGKDNVENTVVGIILIVISVYCGCFLGFYGWQLHQLKDQVLCTKRREHIAVIQIAFSVIGLLLGIPLSIWSHFYWSLDPKKSSIAYPILLISNDVFLAGAVAAAWFQGLMRLWLIFYDIQFSRSQLNLKWKKIITSDCDTLRRDQFWIHYRHNLGNPKLLGKFVIIISSLFVVVTVISSSLRINNLLKIKAWIYVNAIFGLLFLFALLFMWRQIPKFYDHFHLYLEFKLICCFWSLTLFVYIINAVVVWRTGDNLPTSTINYGVQIFGIWVVPHISSFWVLRQIRMSHLGMADPLYLQTPSLSRAEKAELECGASGGSAGGSAPNLTLPDALASDSEVSAGCVHPCAGSMDLPSPSSIVVKAYTIGAPESVRNIIMEEEYLDLFAQHLVEELSTECLLSLIELQQFKKYLCEQLGIQNDAVEETWFDFATNVPQSDIVYHEKKTDLKSFKRRALALYWKYIEEGSDFEVNIDSKMRRALAAVMGNEHEWMEVNGMNAEELSQIFDEVMQEMRLLLKYSRRRFKSDKRISNLS